MRDEQYQAAQYLNESLDYFWKRLYKKFGHADFKIVDACLLTDEDDLVTQQLLLRLSVNGAVCFRQIFHFGAQTYLWVWRVARQP